MILLTGSEGLIGRAFGERLTDAGHEWRGFDIDRNPNEDTRNRGALAKALENVEGVIHLAAVSRVVWAENDPSRALATNVAALQTLIELMHARAHKPWLIFASSREVYGEQDVLPVPESVPLKPLNTYARTKVEGERLVNAAAENGLTTQIVRFSNVYGSIHDHADRVVPAFAKTSALGGSLRVEGSSNLFDFTHVADTSRGLHLLYDAMQSGESMPPIHFLTGKGTTLGELAALAGRNSRLPVTVNERPSRSFDVARFVGDPSRAEELLGWTADVSIDNGFANLVEEFAASHADSSASDSRHAIK
jgi:nucleoside-diphosphate-sugar epimerase